MIFTQEKDQIFFFVLLWLLWCGPDTSDSSSKEGSEVEWSIKWDLQLFAVHMRHPAVSGGRSSKGYDVRVRETFPSIIARRCPWC